MIQARRYTADDADAWNGFVQRSRNGTFLFERGFMDYHADRFTDASLMFERDGRLVALLPQTRHGDEWRSHGGLTYGGLVLADATRMDDVLCAFDAMGRIAREEGVVRQRYSPVPHIYHRYPAEEDRYALHRLGAQCVRSQVDSVVALARPIALNTTRRQGVRRAERAGLTTIPDLDLAPFHAMLSATLSERHGATPVHSLAEMRRLQDRFPDRIGCWGVLDGGEPVAGTWMFSTDRCAHVQYIASTEAGRSKAALDLLFSVLLHHFADRAEFFSFGTSHEGEGDEINGGLLWQKSSFGGRAVVYDTYLLEF